MEEEEAGLVNVLVLVSSHRSLLIGSPSLLPDGHSLTRVSLSSAQTFFRLNALTNMDPGSPLGSSQMYRAVIEAAGR